MKSLQKVWRKARNAVPRSSDAEDGFRKVTPASADNIGIAGNPPLCRNCTRFFCTYHPLDENIQIAGSYAELKKSAELGCYLCRLFLNAEWKPKESHSEDSIQSKRLGDISPPPDLYICGIKRPQGAGVTDILHISGLSAYKSRKPECWRLHLILLPEQDIEVRMNQALLNVNSAGSIANLAKSWIQDCQIKHSSCLRNAHSPGWKPTRLIYVGKPDEDIFPRLCSSSTVPIDKPYFTLSHCWGSVEMFKLVSTNIMDLMTSLPLSDLSSVFRDTIDLVRRLGVDYVWIDSLCIIQDSVEDWNRESALMGEIYENSVCNIAATGFYNGSKSFYVERVPESIQPEKLFVKLGSSKSRPDSKSITGSYYCTKHLWEAGVTDAPLNQRAWVFQERLLAPRVIHMGSEQVFWECREVEACETFPNGIPPPMKSNFKKETEAIINLPVPILGTLLQNGTKSKSLNKVGERVELCDSSQKMLDLWWNEILPGYNPSQLTRFEDKLTAISGIAKEMHKHVGGDYVAGLWGNRILEEILWYVPIWDQMRLGTFVKESQPPQGYQAPSWSWAAINGPVGIIQASRPTLLATLVDYTIVRATKSAYGRVKSGYLRISGMLKRATFVHNDEYLRQNWKDDDVVSLKGCSSTEILTSLGLIPDLQVPVVEHENEHSTTFCYPSRDAIGSRTFWLLPISNDGSSLVGLMLMASGSGIGGEYRRIGVFMAFKNNWVSWPIPSVPYLDAQEYESFDALGYIITIV